MIRVLHVHSPFGWGGVETWLLQTLQHIDRKRVSLDFFTNATRPGVEEMICASGGRVLWAPPTARPWSYLKRLTSVLQTEGPYDAVHTHFLEHGGFVLWCAKRAGVPVRIAHSHGVSNRIGWARGKYFEVGLRLLRKHATMGFADSRKAACFLYGDSWTRDPRWSVLLCGIDLAPFEASEDGTALRASLGIPPDAFVIGHVGRFAPEKNHAFLLGVLKELVKRDPRTLLLLVGDGELQETIRSRAEADGMSKWIRFAGCRPDVPRLMLHAMDAFILPSFCEGLGLVVVEAQAAALPCVISDVVPGEADVVPGLVRRRNLNEPPATWAEELLASRQKQRLSNESALEILRNSPFNIKNMVRRLERAYLEAATDVAGRSLSA